MSLSDNSKKATPKSGMDTLLTLHGKSLKVGEQVRFTLVKGPCGIVQSDPVNPKAPSETFPLIAKFPESVVKPTFGAGKTRLYQQDTPKAQDDSDEEEAAGDQAAKPVRKKGWRRRDAPKRQWVLQSETEFLETMMRKKKKLPMDTKKISTRYEGYPEHNPSHYAIMRVAADDGDVDMTNGGDASPKIQVQLLKPPFATQTFAQPSSRQTLSLRDAEHAIQDQRAHLSRYMMHRRNAPSGSKSRLLGKLNKKEDALVEEDDDVMADVTFTNRKGGTGKARKELLSSLAEDGMKVDEDGVLGGANDAEFGGRRHFGRLAVDKSAKQDEDADRKVPAAEQPAREETDAVGYDGMAMSDDFYDRDIKAEYEDLDYDANEQFDDDDVDLGEAEVVVDPTTGLQDEEEEEDEDELGEVGTGAEGLATVAGFRALLEKARGVTPAEASDGEEEETKSGSRPTSPKGTEPEAASVDGSTADDKLAQVMAAAEKSATAAKAKATAKKEVKKPSAEVVQVDEKGERIVSLEAIRREIWLHHGAIATKRLMKIFNIKKKTTPERRDKFMELVKELCTVKPDPVHGNMLVLKQHYSNVE